MKKYIERISGTVPHTHKRVDIALDGKNLIVTGGNGSGKTSFLRGVYEKTFLLIVQKQQADLPEKKQRLISWKNIFSQQTKGTNEYDNWKNNVNNLEQEISKIESGLLVHIPNNIDLSAKYDENKAVILYFRDTREAYINAASQATGLETEKQEALNQYKQNRQMNPMQFGNRLEQHLLNLETSRQWALGDYKDEQQATEIKEWFDNFEKRLRELFEDETLKLERDPKTFKFSIVQESKPPYTFQTLSAGYRAIFDIYAELLMHTEYLSIRPDALEGIVFIDEIDSHLHVSLQKLILPFFAKSFPLVQFVVTTHSPFVLASMEPESETLIYDLSQEKPSWITEVKSQPEILRDYLQVPTAMPIWAEKRLDAIMEKYETMNPDTISLKALKQELEQAGLAEFFPTSAAQILEAN